MPGTFNRTNFFACCRDFATKDGRVHQYPGPYSVWIMDGASTHCDPNIVNYLRSVGIKVIFLPAYCPFYNPIEIFFGWVKRRFQKMYPKNSGKPLM
jgi:hypothetical protein